MSPSLISMSPRLRPGVVVSFRDVANVRAIFYISYDRKNYLIKTDTMSDQESINVLLLWLWFRACFSMHVVMNILVIMLFRL